VTHGLPHAPATPALLPGLLQELLLVLLLAPLLAPLQEQLLVLTKLQWLLLQQLLGQVWAAP
jgi:hypothetical protein